MPVLGLNHYNLRAPLDVLDELRDFYCETIGLTVGDRPPFKRFGYWLYAGDQAILHLSEAAPGERRENLDKGTFDHVAFACEDIDAMRKHLDELAIAYSIADVPLTRQRQIFLEDPAGNGIELNFQI